MTILFKCSDCGRWQRVEEEKVGHLVRCRRCRQWVAVPPQNPHAVFHPFRPDAEEPPPPAP